jgi:hypothetical protein
VFHHVSIAGSSVIQPPRDEDSAGAYFSVHVDQDDVTRVEQWGHAIANDPQGYVAAARQFSRRGENDPGVTRLVPQGSPGSGRDPEFDERRRPGLASLIEHSTDCSVRARTHQSRGFIDPTDSLGGLCEPLHQPLRCLVGPGPVRCRRPRDRIPAKPLPEALMSASDNGISNVTRE